MLVGIETPNEAAPCETTKLQTLRADRSLVDKVDAIQEAGLDVWCGLIVGFDSDDPGIFARQQEFVEPSRISRVMPGMSHEELRAGYVALQRERHEPGAYFDRLDRLFPAAGFRGNTATGCGDSSTPAPSPRSGWCTRSSARSTTTSSAWPGRWARSRPRS